MCHSDFSFRHPPHLLIVIPTILTTATLCCRSLCGRKSIPILIDCIGCIWHNSAQSGTKKTRDDMTPRCHLCIYPSGGQRKEEKICRHWTKKASCSSTVNRFIN